MTIDLAGLRSTPPGVTADVSGLTDNRQITCSPGIFTFRVCGTALPSGVANGEMTVEVSRERTTTFAVNAALEGPFPKARVAARRDAR